MNRDKRKPCETKYEVNNVVKDVYVNPFFFTLSTLLLQKITISSVAHQPWLKNKEKTNQENVKWKQPNFDKHNPHLQN